MGCQDGEEFKINNYGIKDYKTKKIGSHIYKIKIQLPSPDDTDINFCLLKYLEDKKAKTL